MAGNETIDIDIPLIYKIAGVIAVLLVSLLILNPVRIVPAGSRGVLLTWKAVDGTLGEGIHLIMPIAQDVTLMDVRTQKFETDADSASSDLQSVTAKIALNYHIAPDDAANVYQKIGNEFQDRIISPAIEESTKASTARFTAEQLITRREEVKSVLDKEISDRLSPYGIIVDGVNIVNFKFSDQFNAAIEAKVTAEQDALAAKNKLEQIKFEAQQTIEQAKGVADGKLLVAQAEAKSIQLQGDALRNNPEVASLRAIEKWNGVLPVYMFGSGSNLVPFVNIPLSGAATPSQTGTG